jgi:spore maturation protein CgeB
MRAEGLDVTVFDLEARRKSYARLGPIGRHLSDQLDFQAWNARANRALAMVALDVRPTVLVVLGTHAVRPATLLFAKASLPGMLCVNIFPDTIFNITERVFETLRLYDLFCVHSSRGADALRRAGFASAYYLPLAADPELHFPRRLSRAQRRRYEAHATYVGTHRPEHAALFDGLQDVDLAIWGNGWGRAESRWVRSRWRGRALGSPEEYSAAYQAAAIGLNPLDPLDQFDHNMRTFELPACGVFSLVTRSESVLALFDEDVSVACFEGPEELRDKVAYYLQRDGLRRSIAESARRLVVEGGHTYRDRVRTLVRQLSL